MSSNNQIAQMNLDDDMKLFREEQYLMKALKQNKPPKSQKSYVVNDDKLANEDLKELNYLLQIDKILNEASQNDKSVGRRIKSVVTEEMIKEYKDELNKPVIVTDDHGVEHSYKYHPASTTPQLDAYPPLAVIRDEPTLNALIHDEVNKIHVERLKLDRINARIARVIDMINTGSYKKMYGKKAGKNQKEAIDKENLANEKILHDEKDTLDFDKIPIQNDIITLEANIRALQDEILNIPILVSENQAKISITDIENKNKISNYADELKVLNSGALNTDRFENETDNDYLDRLKQNAQTPSDNSYLEIEAEIFNVKKFKENMKHLISSDSNIESIMKNLDTDEIFNINSVFNIIQEQFLKVFGYNNKNISIDEITDFLLNYAYKRSNLIAGSKATTTTTPLMLPPPAGMAVAPPFIQVSKDVRLITDHNMCIFINTDTGTELYFKLSNKKNVGEKLNKRLVMFSYTGNVGTYENVSFLTKDPTNPRNFLKLLIEDIGLTKQDINTIFKGGITMKKVEDWLSKEQGLKEEPATIYNKVVVAGKYDEHVYGMGLHLAKIPKFCQFGKIFIKLDKLFYKNILAVKDQNKFNIHGFKDCPVSDEFVELIMKMCKGHQPTPSDIKNLKLNEKEIFDMLLYTSGVHKTVHTNTKDSTIEKLKSRLELVEGEIESGNNNIKLLHELGEILNKLSNLGVIAKANAKKHFDAIRKDFF